MPLHIAAAEAYLPGCPDKTADAFADALVAAALRRDALARCDFVVSHNAAQIRVTGRLWGAEGLDIANVFASDGRPVYVNLDRDPFVEQQAVAVGYAIDAPALNDLPGEYVLVQRLARRLDRLRHESADLRLGGDGMLIALMEKDFLPRRLTSLCITLRQAADGPAAALRKSVRAVVQSELDRFAQDAPGFETEIPEGLIIREVRDGPSRALGVSGVRAARETYGSQVAAAAVGLSGKDFLTPARGGAIAARRLAKAVVRTGAARECLATLVYAPGGADGQIVSLFGDGVLLDPSRWAPLLDRTLAAVAARAAAVPLADVARFGHFLDPDLPWEKVHFDAR